MDLPRKDGYSKRQHLESLSAYSKAVQALTPPEIPPGAEYILQMYKELLSNIGEEILQSTYCWKKLMGIRLSPYEVNILMTLVRVNRHVRMKASAEK